MSKITDLMKNRGMSYTEAVRELRHPSAEGPCEIAAPVGTLALTTGSLLVPHVTFLLLMWQKRADRYRGVGSRAIEPDNNAIKREYNLMAATLDECIIELRAQWECANQRQPEENK